MGALDDPKHSSKTAKVLTWILDQFASMKASEITLGQKGHEIYFHLLFVCAWMRWILAWDCTFFLSIGVLYYCSEMPRPMMIAI